ncbi:MAG: DEAD/DEAH box helicase family protein [Myxococcota bacterium]
MQTALLRFHAGTLELRGVASSLADSLGSAWKWDPRSECYRAPALEYAAVVTALHRKELGFEDLARAYGELTASLRVHREPRPYQKAALSAWKSTSRGRGVVVLPTGSGKSHLAVMAIADKARATLVVAPTLDLVRQWYDLLRLNFGVKVGIVGGGEHSIETLTVTTYDSAYLHMEHFGNRFGLIVFDECHHLPSETYALSAKMSVAPFRLGLTATPERADGKEAELESLIGPTVYREDIVDLRGDYLAEYETVRVVVELDEVEREIHDRARNIYLAFVRSQGIRLGSPAGFQDFIQRSAQTAEGRRAMRAYREQRTLAFAASAKLEYLDMLLFRHRHDRSIVFTQDNATAYEISRRFLVPVITHQTKISERSSILSGLSEGTYSAVVTSKVLNEGVDVPSANVAVVVSGSGSVREHVQRLGRILRKKGEKQAVLYELITERTSEKFTSERRREHSAYR